MKIDFANINKQYHYLEKRIKKRLNEVLASSQFILGKEVSELEEKLKEFCNAQYSITVSSGTDALIISLLSIGISPGDEVITPVFTFIATAEVISLLGAKPVFVDIKEETFNINYKLIEEKITEKTKAIIPVSLFGQIPEIDEINKIAKKYNLTVIEDGAQSFGAEYKGKKSCNLTDIGCTSFFPAKPLGCYGDGGAIFTNNEELYIKMKALRVHGQTERYNHKYIGINGRMDTIQAAILLEKLNIFPEEIEKRNNVANKYIAKLKNCPELTLPKIKNNRLSTWAQFSILTSKRELLKKYLNQNGIPTAVHYPIPLHLQECFKYLGYRKGDFPVAEKIANEILSIPMNPYLEDNEIDYICNCIINFFEK